MALKIDTIHTKSSYHQIDSMQEHKEKARHDAEYLSLVSRIEALERKKDITSPDRDRERFDTH